MGINTKIKAIFLDRDGVLNKPVIIDGKPYPPSTVEDVVIGQGVSEGLKTLKALGFLLIVITNQPDIARGKTTFTRVNKINNYLQNKLKLDDVFVCPHDDKDNCNCRKPKPGLVFLAQKKWKIDLSNSFFVGDRWKDIETGQNAGLKTILINYGYNEKYVKPHYSCTNFVEVTQIIETLIKQKKL